MSTEQIASFIVGTTYKHLPEKGVDDVKRSILDCLGVILAGSDDPGSLIIIDYVKELGGKSEAGVISAGFKTTAAHAAWANGTIAHALDYDDSSGFIIGHPTVAILPGILALAEKHHLSGRDLLTAYIVGFEVAARLGPISAQHYANGWHATCTLGSVGAAAAAAKLLGLNEQQSRMALGIACSLAGGLKQNFGTMTKPLHAGNAAKNGVVAAELAARGFTADANLLENPQQGFLKVFNAGGEVNLSKVADALGQRYDVVSGIMLKPYPSCLLTHRPIEAAITLKKRSGVNAADIEDVELRCDASVPRTVIHTRPKAGLEGKFSNQYCVARALLDGELGTKHFTDSMVLQPEAQELLRKVRYVHPADWERMTVELVVKLKNGQTLTQKITHQKGSLQNPLTWDDVRYKYGDCVAHKLPKEAAERCMDLVSNLESVPDVSAVSQLLTAQAARNSVGVK